MDTKKDLRWLECNKKNKINVENLRPQDENLGRGEKAAGRRLWSDESLRRMGRLPGEEATSWAEQFHGSCPPMSSPCHFLEGHTGQVIRAVPDFRTPSN